MLLKIIVEIYQNIKNGTNIYKSEKEKLIKEINNLIEINESYPENSKKLNIKLKQNNPSKINDEKSNNNCLLCLDKRKETSSTICGHLFCWSCITKYLQTNTQCPFCRQECHPQNIVLLQNFS